MICKTLLKIGSKYHLTVIKQFFVDGGFEWSGSYKLPYYTQSFGFPYSINYSTVGKTKEEATIIFTKKLIGMLDEHL